jgi:hypothetical protein
MNANRCRELDANFAYHLGLYASDDFVGWPQGLFPETLVGDPFQNDWKYSGAKK